MVGFTFRIGNCDSISIYFESRIDSHLNVEF